MKDSTIELIMLFLWLFIGALEISGEITKIEFFCVLFCLILEKLEKYIQYKIQEKEKINENNSNGEKD